jgi:predicted Zn-dependent peptidase
MHIIKKVLPNGVRIICAPMPGNPTATYMVMVRSGAFNEVAETSGISHFLEHMSFKGTTKRPSQKDMALFLDSIGASYNAWTGKEQTAYFAKADTRHFDAIADVISDIYLEPLLPEAEIEKERGVITGEIDMYEDEPQEKVWDALIRLMYGDKQPAGWETLGPKENVKRFTRDDFLMHRALHCKAENTIVVIAGGMDVDRAFSIAEASFSKLPSGAIPERLSVIEEGIGGHVSFVERDIDQAHIAVGFRAIHKFNEDRYTVSIIRNILSGGMSSRLWQSLREERGSGYYLGANTVLHDTHGRFHLFTGTESARVPEIVGVLLNETKKLACERVSDAELKKVKDFITGRRAMSLETSDDVADFIGGQEIEYGVIHTPEEVMERIIAVTPEDILRVSQYIFAPGRAYVAIVGKNINEDAVRVTLAA